MPSEVRGNLRCTTDDDEIVYGYVGVAYPATAEFYMSSTDIGNIYQRPVHELEPAETPAAKHLPVTPRAQPPKGATIFNIADIIAPLILAHLAEGYNKVWRPYSHDPFTGWSWLPARCVDCRFAGGTKNRPDNWPTDHQ